MKIGLIRGLSFVLLTSGAAQSQDRVVACDIAVGIALRFQEISVFALREMNQRRETWDAAAGRGELDAETLELSKSTAALVALPIASEAMRLGQASIAELKEACLPLDE